MKTSCERCGTSLPPDSKDAMICSFECTFCRRCSEELLTTCPNCGGALLQRPARKPAWSALTAQEK
ncbi:MAG: DUF1272 domain-containing protein [Acidobacteriaceae bacterium]|nr:DUF1272 domain-containing protein [Acidobacteriaceae bacterium]